MEGKENSVMSDLTCWSILVAADDGPPQSAFGALESVATLAGSVAGGNRAAVEDDITRTARRLTQELLDVSIVDALAKAFTTYRDLAETADPRRHPADETIEKLYAEHRLEARVEPRIRVRLNGVDLPPIQLKCVIELTATGLVLSIRQGRIRSCAVGRLEADGTLHVGSTRIYRTPQRRIYAGLSFEFAEGIPISRAAALGPTPQQLEHEHH
jgi:hypothetical protein